MRRPLCFLLGLLGLATQQALADKDKPDIESHLFGDAPNNILYFEDSDVILASDNGAMTTYRSDDAGVTWNPLDGVREGEVYEVLKHPFDKQTAVVLGTEKKHWITRDRGETWESFKSEADPSRSRPGISFHAHDPKRMLYLAEDCVMGSLFCENSVYYTMDGFQTDPKRLGSDDDGLISCLWSQTTELFTTGDDDLDSDQILCVALGKYDTMSKSNRVLVSSDYFETSHEPVMSDGRTIQGITNLAAVKRYIVFAAKADRTSELAMYVTDDTKIWHRAEFGEHRLEENTYTLLESTNYSMQVDVMTASSMAPMGVLLTSNSNGTFFTKNIEHTNRNMQGFVDFEKISNIQGIVLVNTVANWETVERDYLTDHQVETRISFDDGRTWEDLDADGKRLHLHSVTQQRNMGRIYSSPAPGIVMGVGNTGKFLRDYSEGDLYVSDDAGLTWSRALTKPHLYEFGAQGSILVAVEDDETNKIKWSLDHGKTWDSTEMDEKVKPVGLTTTPDSTSLKFLMIASHGRGSKLRYYTYALDFNGLHERECKSSDFEDWNSRTDANGTAICVMGQLQYFKRRKADAKCVVANDHFKDPEESREPCECTERDYECDYDFRRDDHGGCTQTAAIAPPKGSCDKNDDTFKGPSGFRLIPGNQCTGGVDLTKDIQRSCNSTKSPDESGKIHDAITTFKGDTVVEYYYLERTEKSSGTDETIIMRTNRREVWLTHDHGKNWEQVMKKEEVRAIYPHQYLNDNVYLITPSKTVFYSKDRGKTWHEFEAPDAPNQDNIQVLSFHPSEPDWLIWTGGRDCKKGSCKTIAHGSTHGGQNDWRTLLPAVRKCQFVYREDRAESDELVFCEQYRDEDEESPLELISSSDWFDHKTSVKGDVINFATMAEYIVVAMRDEDQKSLKIETSIDGVNFAHALFPKNLEVLHQQAYTVLDSSTHAIFLHVTVNNREDQEYGSIIKSNSNGTSYVLSADYVNRNEFGYVDFAKIQGLEGVAVINRVGNVDDVENGSLKKLKTYITHNDGADWALLGRPKGSEDSACKGRDEKCSLHLHGYTEWKDPRDTYSSASAIGLMMGVGNVGEFLEDKKEADTFITRDGGLNWDLVMKGSFMWEYGDQGSIIVIVKEDEPTDSVLYSLDEGKSWITHKLAHEMVVHDLSTVPSDTSRNFLLWGKIGGKLATMSLDFTSMTERSTQCRLDHHSGGDDDEGDYYLWSPKHPTSEDDCLFGHIAQYHRKKPEAECYNGEGKPELHEIIKTNCTCTLQDFECEYNYERGAAGICKLAEGLEKPDPLASCKANPFQQEYNDITGYRRIPLTTCTGGVELEKTSKTYPCPGWEGEYKQRHGLGPVGIFFAVLFSLMVASGIGYWAWTNWSGSMKFGRIRLGDGLGGGDGGGGAGAAFDREAPWIKYPVMAVSGAVAVIAAIPLVVSSLWRAASTRFGWRQTAYSRPFTSRDSFQRGRGNYSVVDPDEGELLGDDSDEEV